MLIPLPGTDLYPTALCLGTADFGGTVNQETAISILDACVEAGGNFIDTAKVYNDWIPGERSRSEKLIGAWMNSRRNRERIILATKGAHFELDTPQIPRLTARDIAEDVEDSLRHLRTDRIDLYWLHRDDPNQPVEAILDALEQQVAAEKIRYYGGSNWTADRVMAAQQYARRRGWAGFTAVQNMWNLSQVNRDAINDPTIVVMDDGLWDLHRREQIPAIPYSSQAGGFFHKLESSGVDGLPVHLRSVFFNQVTEQRAARLMQIKQQTGLTTTQVVLGYLLSQPFPVIPIFSARSLEQLADTLTAADVRLTAEQTIFLRDGITAPGAAQSPAR